MISNLLFLVWGAARKKIRFLGLDRSCRFLSAFQLSQNEELFLSQPLLTRWKAHDTEPIGRSYWRQQGTSEETLGLKLAMENYGLIDLSLVPNFVIGNLSGKHQFREFPYFEIWEFLISRKQKF